MPERDLKARTRRYAVQIVRFVDALPKCSTGSVIGRQLLRCGTSIGANYRSTAHAKSQRDFIAKMGIVEEEADETAYWLEILMETNMMDRNAIERLLKEANELTAISVSSIRTARNRLETEKGQSS
jgi:four helix bundle protein